MPVYSNDPLSRRTPGSPTPTPSSHLIRCDWRGGGRGRCMRSWPLPPCLLFRRTRRMATGLRTTCQRDHGQPSDGVDHRPAALIVDLGPSKSCAAAGGAVANGEDSFCPVGCVDQHNTDGPDPTLLRNVMVAAVPVRRSTSVFPLHQPLRPRQSFFLRRPPRMPCRRSRSRCAATHPSCSEQGRRSDGGVRSGSV